MNVTKEIIDCFIKSYKIKHYDFEITTRQNKITTIIYDEMNIAFGTEFLTYIEDKFFAIESLILNNFLTYEKKGKMFLVRIDEKELKNYFLDSMEERINVRDIVMDFWVKGGYEEESVLMHQEIKLAEETMEKIIKGEIDYED